MPGGNFWKIIPPNWLHPPNYGRQTMGVLQIRTCWKGLRHFLKFCASRRRRKNALSLFFFLHGRGNLVSFSVATEEQVIVVTFCFTWMFFISWESLVHVTSFILYYRKVCRLQTCWLISVRRCSTLSWQDLKLLFRGQANSCQLWATCCR